MEINVKEILRQWEDSLKEQINNFPTKPKLVIIHDENMTFGSQKYVSNKCKKGQDLNCTVDLVSIPTEKKSKNEILKSIGDELCRVRLDKDVNGVIVQLPLAGLREKDIKHLIPMYKDVDGFTDYQKSLLMDGSKDALVPCTAKGVMKILESVHKDLSGKQICIVNRSWLIGMPLFFLALQKNMTPIICHTKTDWLDKKNATRNSDIVVTGCGQRKIFNSSDFNIGVETIIDCSMDKVEGIPGVGDCDKENILKYLPSINVASGYGNTGPATVMSLFDNLVKAYKMQNKIK